MPATNANGSAARPVFRDGATPDVGSFAHAVDAWVQALARTRRSMTLSL